MSMKQAPVRYPQRPQAPYVYSSAPPVPEFSEGNFWEKYKIWIIAFAAIAIGAGIYFWMKSKQDEAERVSKKERLQWRYKAQEYGEHRARELAQQLLSEELKKRGIRHDIGDPGIQSNLGATHDWETNPKQKASPEGAAVTTEINQVAAPAPEPPYEPEQDDKFDEPISTES